MDEPFELEVPYKGKTECFQLQLQVVGYTFRFIVPVHGKELWIERDEEGSYRALLPYDSAHESGNKIDKELVEAILQKLQEVLA